MEVRWIARALVFLQIRPELLVTDMSLAIQELPEAADIVHELAGLLGTRSASLAMTLW